MEEKHAGGRPTKYDPETHLKAAKKMAELGGTDEEIAEGLGVAPSTLYLWKIKHKEFSESLRRGKAVSDQRVEDALYHRALGYTHDEVDIRVVEGQIVKTPTKKHYPPDSTSLIFWLKNRRPDLWRDKPEGEEKEQNENILRVQIERVS